LSETIAFYKEKEGRVEKETREIPVPKVAIPEPKTTRRDSRWPLLRWLVFFFSSALVLWLVALPIANLVINTYLGNKNLQQAVDKLANDKSQVSGQQAAKAEGAYKNGEKLSQNISWLGNLLRLKKTMKETENYLFLGENLSTTTRLLAEAQTAIINASDGGLSEEQTIENLKTARNKTDLAKKSLEIATTVRCEEGSLPTPLRADYQRLIDDEKKLTAFINSIDEALRAIF